MARNKWSIAGGKLTVDGNVNGTFDLTEVSPNWETLEETEQFIVSYGVKQWLSDKMAGSDDPAKSLADGWDRMKDGDFARKAGARSGITKAALKKERDELAAKVAALEAELAASKVVLRKKGK